MSKRIEQLLSDLLANGRNSLSLVMTSLIDSNSNEIIKTTAVSSAKNELTISNAGDGAAPVITTSGDSDSNVSLRIQAKGSGVIMVEDPLLRVCSPATITTAGAGTYSAANLLSGLILRDANGSSRTDTTATASQIVSAIPAAVANQFFDVIIRNTADAAETLTIAGGTGVTLSAGANTIPQNYSRVYRFVLTNVGSGTESVTAYCIGYFQH